VNHGETENRMRQGNQGEWEGATTAHSPQSFPVFSAALSVVPPAPAVRPQVRKYFPKNVSVFCQASFDGPGL
jgi:hypothetical protein